MPAERYMDDISDPGLSGAWSIRLADTMTKRYAKHPALLAIGFDNEIGNGFMSYSAADRTRFVDWLKEKYGSIEALNRAWATQRWSRRINDWDEVELPVRRRAGAVERQLDLRRYWSDVTIGALEDLEAIRKKNAPNKPAISNLWDSGRAQGLRLSELVPRLRELRRDGLLPGRRRGSQPRGADGESRSRRADLVQRVHRRRRRLLRHERPVADVGPHRACSTRRAGGAGVDLQLPPRRRGAGAVRPRRPRRTPSWKLDEFAPIASEFQKLASLGFPRIPKAQGRDRIFVRECVASSPPGRSNVRQYYLAVPKQAHNAFEPFYKDNIDVAIVNAGRDPLDGYKLVIVPGQYVMDERCAAGIRRYVEGGGTVVMTGYSAKADEHAQWFNTALPGRLADVFGLHTNAFYRSDAPLEVTIGDEVRKGTDRYYEVLALDTAKPLANFLNTPEKSPAVAINRYGRGQAIYVATAAQPSIVGPLVRTLYGSLGIERGPETPPGVYARIVEGRTLYVNTTTAAATVRIDGAKRGVLSGRRYSEDLVLEPYGVELLE